MSKESRPAAKGDGEVTKRMVPPDGGWGWVVVSAFAINYVIAVPMMQSFGLIFKDTFRRINMSALDSATVLNVNAALSFGFGLANGPLLRKYSYRMMAVTGSVLIFIGITSTAFARTFTHIIITYSVITVLIFFNSISAVLGIAVFLGVAKGIRTVYMSLVLPSYVPLEKLAGASGIQMLVNGLLFAAFGPLMGLLRDWTGSYVNCIYFVNGMTLITVITWILERIICGNKGFHFHT